MEEGFRSLIVWQKAYVLVLDIYKATKNFPKHEQYGLITQIRRASISVCGNIAEGYERQYRKEYIHFLSIARGSMGELEAYLLLAKDLGYLNTVQYLAFHEKRKEVSRVLKGLIRSLSP